MGPCRSQQEVPSIIIDLASDAFPLLLLLFSIPTRLSEFNQDDGHSLTPQQLYAWLARLMYNRRSKIDPLWNSFIVGGYTPPTSSETEAKGKPFLGFVDLLGVTYQSSTIATGFGMHLAQPLLRTAVEGKEDVLTEEQARAILEGCMKVLCEYAGPAPARDSGK